MTVQRIGYACKYVVDDKAEYKRLNQRATTRKKLMSLPVPDARALVREIVEHNINSMALQFSKLATMPLALRMCRIGSEVIPLYSHEYFSDVLYPENDEATVEFNEFLSAGLYAVGEFARVNDIRLSFHPGQFTVLASDRPDVVEKSITEFEYHATVARLMGYGREFQDFKCNVHLSGKGGVPVFRETFERLSPEAQRIITIENDEFTSSLDRCLEIADLCPVVLDVHHHYINCGQYIQPEDPRIEEVIASWRSKRPVLHYSVSPEEYVPQTTGFPSLSELVESGIPRSKLRKHSDFYHNTCMNKWITKFRDKFDIMCESKMKNVASFQLYESIK